MQTRIFHENMLKYNHIISKGDLPMNRKKRTYLTAIFLAAVLPLTGILSGQGGGLCVCLLPVRY